MMDRLWDLGEDVVLSVAHWVVCAERPLEEVPDLSFTSEEISTALAVKEKDKVEEAIQYCKELFEREEERTRTVESKAITLTGFAGLTAAFVSGFAGLLLDGEKIPCKPALAVLLVLYVLVVCSFVRTILCALRVVTVGDPYRFAYPAPDDILRLNKKALDDIRRERAADFFKSYVTNHVINNNKASYLKSAQRGFATAVFFLLLTTMVFAGYALLAR